ncbi:hypothetical protein RI129_009088 [Pyrocoelia pectoralis]|uniref:C2 domain-containing protein n=1 Tax=Pyrocoelia pectoralis TaxID=417401 RepID=A0AAN7ZLT3_9COLE
MSLSVKVNQFLQIPKTKGEKILKIEFRGVSHISHVLEDATGEKIVIDQRFDWPIGRPLDHNEFLQIELISRNRLLPDKIIGIYGLLLQRVISDGRLNISDNLIDSNHKTLPTIVEFDVVYIIPDVTTGSIAESAHSYDFLDDDQQMLIDIEQNIANLERSLSTSRAESVGGSIKVPRKSLLHRAISLTTSSQERLDKKKTSALKNVKNLIKIGKQRPPKSRTASEESLIYADDFGRTSRISGSESAPISRAGSETSVTSIEDNFESAPILEVGKKARVKPDLATTVHSVMKALDFQISITIIEGRQLTGLNMDPVVCIQIGDQKKYTSVKESTNCPYYNEYFVFDFHMPAIMLFDKIITLTVWRSRKLRSNKFVGSFKLDVGTVWYQTDHQFYHKWALLTDPDDITGGPKGYLKCDISVIGKGDNVRVPQISEKDEDNIEANLLLPDGVPIDRQHARFIIKIYRADGLPKMNSSIMANVKKAFTGESNDLVDPYVQVSFAGLMGQTTVKKNSYAPVWNEQLVFTEMFPPLCQRIKIQLRDNDPVNPKVIGTHFIDLKEISNDGEKGFLPTFGPSFVHLYGSTRDYSIIDEHSNLNIGLGEGVSYRGRILLALRMELIENIELIPSDVELEQIPPISETAYGKNDEFFLFATILEANMIEKRLGDKPMYFEISVGNAGNEMDGHNHSKREHIESDSEDLEAVVTDSASWQSTTPPTKPMTHNKLYYFLPYWDNKPCMHIKSVWPDYRRRMYISNQIEKISEKLDDGLQDVHHLIEMERGGTEFRLKQVLDEVTVSCEKYVLLAKDTQSGSGTGKTKLDKERMKLCQREIENMGTMARNLRAVVTKSSLKERYKTAQSYLTKLKSLIEDPQHAVPDIFLWLVSGGKRQAYHRILARNIIYSNVDEERGKSCGKVQTIFLKLPGKKAMGPTGWSIQAKLQISIWLGLLKQKKNFLNGIPKGYEITQEIRNADRPRALPPLTIHYTEKHIFQLRAHIYEARSLIGSDASGLSDPFARVIAGEYSKTTQVIDETVSPTWDELLVFDEILIYGTSEDIQRDPPSVIIEIFDQDKVGKSEFIGRTMAKPHVKLRDDAYSKPTFPPSLEWFDVRRSAYHAGELLATFELLEYPSEGNEGALPPQPPPKQIPIYKDTDTKEIGPILPIPKGIRPTLSTYRIEVLFWGLRDLKRVHLMTVDKPRVDIDCSGHTLFSPIIQNARKNPNFSGPIKFLDLELPEQELYRPPLTIRAVDCRSFGRYTLVGTHTINSIQKYMYVPRTRRDREAEERKRAMSVANQVIDTQPTLNASTDDENKEKSPLLPKDPSNAVSYGSRDPTKKIKQDKQKKQKNEAEEELEDDDDDKDWWTKYYTSSDVVKGKEGKHTTSKDQNLLQPDISPSNLQDVQVISSKSTERKPKFGFKTVGTATRFVAKLSPKAVRKVKPKYAHSRIFDMELEKIPEFEGFKEWLNTFELYRGKKTDDESEDDNRIVGSFKGAIKIYKWPLPKDFEDFHLMGFDINYGLFQGLPSNEQIRVLIRVYIVKAIDLHPMDINGKADPYIVLQLGAKRVSDKENYVSKQLNPVFGKCFEFEATFPQDSLLTVQIFDWDLVSSDDMIGETKIDLENRFYSRHRATCGLALKYEEDGYNAWRDPMKPTQILSKLCKDARIDPPVYMPGNVKVGRITVPVHVDEDCDLKMTEERMALVVLHKWYEFPIGCHLTPEHIETRPKDRNVGRYVPMDMPLPGPPTNISPRKPKGYELRVIIWNTDEVVLEDDAFFTGEKMSDIYVKGWLKGSEDCQSTDIHYRSLTGEGNFNWRFVYDFDYLSAEKRIVITKKESLFSWDETESKIPSRLELQVWDADHFSADDFLGALTLDLNKFPRGAKSAKLCTLDMLTRTDGSVPMVNIFKQKRIKGWWPFYVKKDNEVLELTGKVEAELHLLTQEEAEKNPVGLGRNEPEPLEKPNRPDSSFVWFLNPLKAFRYILWQNFKWKILKLLIFMGLTLLILLFFYSLPGYTAKRMVGAK